MDDPKDRSSSFKNQGKDTALLRQQRAATSVELRKHKRDEHLFKKRNVAEELCEENSSDSDEKVNYLFSAILSSAANIHSPEPIRKLEAVQRIRKVLSQAYDPPIDEVIGAGVLPKLVECLKANQDPVLQFETAWALTSVASGTSAQTSAVVECGAVELFIQLLGSPHQRVYNQSVWALGNIIGDGPSLRDYVIRMGLLPPLFQLVNDSIPQTFLCNITWVLVNICRCKSPPVQLTIARQLLPMLSSLLTHEDCNVVLDTVWALLYLTDSGNGYIQLVLDAGLAPCLVHLLGSSESKIQLAALRTLGNISTGSDEQTQQLLDCQVLTTMVPLLEHGVSKLIKEAIWFLSNITAGRTDQVQMVLDANLLPLIIFQLDKGDFQIQKEATWAIGNLAVSGSPPQLECVIAAGAVKPLCRMLTVKDNQVIQLVLDCLHCLLKSCDGHSKRVCQEVEECGGLDKLEHLQGHENQLVYRCAAQLITEYFEDEDDDPVTGASSLPPAQVSPDTRFNF